MPRRFKRRACIRIEWGRDMVSSNSSPALKANREDPNMGTFLSMADPESERKLTSPNSHRYGRQLSHGIHRSPQGHGTPLRPPAAEQRARPWRARRGRDQLGD